MKFSHYYRINRTTLHAFESLDACDRCGVPAYVNAVTLHDVPVGRKLAGAIKLDAMPAELGNVEDYEHHNGFFDRGEPTTLAQSYACVCDSCSSAAAVDLDEMTYDWGDDPVEPLSPSEVDDSEIRKLGAARTDAETTEETTMTKTKTTATGNPPETLAEELMERANDLYALSHGATADRLAEMLRDVGSRIEAAQSRVRTLAEFVRDDVDAKERAARDEREYVGGGFATSGLELAAAGETCATLFRIGKALNDAVDVYEEEALARREGIARIREHLCRAAASRLRSAIESELDVI